MKFTTEQMKEMLIDFYMDNPSLDEEMDYLPHEDRQAYYTDQVNGLTTSEIRHAFKSIGDE